LACVIPGVAALGLVPSQPAPLDDTQSCISAWGEAQSRYPGYDHVVYVRNDCEKRAHCSVATNVDPDPHNLVVDPGTTGSLLVRRGSPSREFTPQVTCAIEK
jgi:hypothetical protein